MTFLKYGKFFKKASDKRQNHKIEQIILLKPLNLSVSAMLRKLHVNLLFVSLFFLLTNFKNKDGQVKIKINAPGSKQVKAGVVVTDMLDIDAINLAEATTDDKGKALLDFSLTKPVFAFITLADRSYPVYLNPFDDLEITINEQNTGHEVTYKGSGAKTNAYLLQVNATKQKYENVDGKIYFQVALDKYMIARDSREKTLAGLLSELVSRSTLSAETKELLAAKNKMAMLLYDQNYVFSKFGPDNLPADLPESVKSNVLNVPLHPGLLKVHLGEYAQVMSFYFNRNYYARLYGLHNAKDSIRSFPIFGEMEIRKAKYSKEMEKYFLAKNISHWLANEGITPEIEMVYKNWLKEPQHVEFVSSLEKKFDNWQVLAPGKPAPVITGINKDGKIISSRDLKGKIIYVDVWATWCKPCRESFPDVKKVIENFAGNDKIVFLFVSVDRNVQAWQKLLEEGNIPKGIHINQDDDDNPQNIWKSYKVQGIPRYILINGDGNIVQSNATSPSSGKLVAELEALLASNKSKEK